MYSWNRSEKHVRDEISFPGYGCASDRYDGSSSGRNSHKLDKHMHAQLSWADKYTAHVYAPVSHKALAKYLDKHIARQDSCDGEEHICF